MIEFFFFPFEKLSFLLASIHSRDKMTSQKERKKKNRLLKIEGGVCRVSFLSLKVGRRKELTEMNDLFDFFFFLPSSFTAKVLTSSSTMETAHFCLRFYKMFSSRFYLSLKHFSVFTGHQGFFFFLGGRRNGQTKSLTIIGAQGLWLIYTNKR